MPCKPVRTFNWTKVELKPALMVSFGQCQRAFNWTKVELKQEEPVRDEKIFPPFNWTKVELKQIPYSLSGEKEIPF